MARGRLAAPQQHQCQPAAGTVTHKLRVGGNEELELYDWPGEYAQRYDGIEPSGGEQPAEVL